MYCLDSVCAACAEPRRACLSASSTSHQFTVPVLSQCHCLASAALTGVPRPWLRTYLGRSCAISLACPRNRSGELWYPVAQLSGNEQDHRSPTEMPGSTTAQKAAGLAYDFRRSATDDGAKLEAASVTPRLALKQANGAELWAKIVACGLIGSGPAGLSLVGERFGEGLRCVEFTDVEGGWFLGG